MRRLRMSAVSVSAAAVVAAGLLTFSPAGAAEVDRPTPLADSFYSTPKNTAEKKNGDILRVRQRPAPPGFFQEKTYHLQFRSTDSHGEPIAAVTTVMVPDSARKNGPLPSFQHVVNALGLKCAPSQALWTSDPNLAIREAPALNVALQRGWTVSIPDHLGPAAPTVQPSWAVRSLSTPCGP